MTVLNPKIAEALSLMERTRRGLQDAGAEDSEPECALHMMIHRALAGWPSFPDMYWAVFTQEADERLDEIGEHLYQVIQSEASFCDYGPLLAFAKRGSPNLAFARVRDEGGAGLGESNTSKGAPHKGAPHKEASTSRASTRQGATDCSGFRSR